MKVRFEIFKSFIRVDLQLQLEVEVAYTKENPSCLRFFWEDGQKIRKKKTGVCGARYRTRRCLFLYNPAASSFKKNFKTRIWPGVG